MRNRVMGMILRYQTGAEKGISRMMGHWCVLKPPEPRVPTIESQLNNNVKEIILRTLANRHGMVTNDPFLPKDDAWTPHDPRRARGKDRSECSAPRAVSGSVSGDIKRSTRSTRCWAGIFKGRNIALIEMGGLRGNLLGRFQREDLLPSAMNYDKMNCWGREEGITFGRASRTRCPLGCHLMTLGRADHPRELQRGERATMRYQTRGKGDPHLHFRNAPLSLRSITITGAHHAGPRFTALLHDLFPNTAIGGVA